MTWFRIDDSFYDHPKVFDAPDCAVALWTRAGTWSARNLTDGFVPAGMPARLCDDPDTAVRELLRRGLWSRSTGGFQFHDWTDHQPLAADVKALREKRAAAGRRGGLAKAKQASGKSQASANGVAKQNATPTRPDPSFRGGAVRGEGPETRRARDTPTPQTPATQRPPDRCTTHADDPHPPPCGHCADARRAAEQWDTEQATAAREARSAEARAAAEARALAIANCGLCDDHGYAGRVLCDHDPNTADRAKRGLAAVQAALRRPSTQDPP